MTQDTGPANLPALPSLAAVADPAVRKFLEVVKERLEVREGSRGNKFERTVLVRDLEAAGLQLGQQRRGQRPGEFPIDIGNGATAFVSIAQFAEMIRNTRLYKDLTADIRDPKRFDTYATELKALLMRNITDVAISAGAAVTRNETTIQSVQRSLAMAVVDITAALDNNRAGIREVQAASATLTNAQAVRVVQLEARLDGAPVDPALIDATVYDDFADLEAAVTTPDTRLFYQVLNPVVEIPALDNLLYRYNGSDWVQAGLGQVATIEEIMSVTADRANGVAAQYTLKVDAKGKVAGFGLAAESSESGAGTSAFIILADKFAIVSSSDTITDPTDPDVDRIPFGVDVTGVYINGNLRVNSGGQTLNDLITEDGIKLTYTSQFFKYDTTGAVVNSTVTLTANVVGSLTGTLEWTAVSGYSGSMPSDFTVVAPGAVDTATINAADMTADTATFSITLTDGADVYTDIVTLVKLRDGTDALASRLTNNAVGIPATSAGVPITGAFGGANGTMEVYRGATKLTSGVTYSLATSGNPSGLTYSINSSTGAYTVTAKGSWPDATMLTSIKFRATIGAVTLDETFTLTKAPQGSSGLYKDYYFRRATSAPSAPSTGSEPTAQGWSDTPPSGTDPLYMTTADRDVLTNVVSGTWTTPVRIDGATGQAGQYIESQYTKNTSPTSAPSSGWASTQPSLSAGEFMWMQTRTVVPPAAAPAWGAAVRISGEQGPTGAAGQNVAIVYAYRRSATALGATASPGDTADTGTGGAASYTFSTKALVLSSGSAWSTTPPAGDEPLYVSVATAASATDSDSIPASEWSNPVLFVKDGTKFATVSMYMRTATGTAPTITSSGSDATYTFSTKAVAGLPSSTGGTWSATVPSSGGAYLWVSMATASSLSDTDSIAYTEWSAARLLATDGATGATGDAVDIVFKRSATQPSTPAASSSTPATWYTDVNSVPAGSDLIWSSVGQRASGAANYTWQTPVRIEGSDGSDGAAGLSIVELTVYTRGTPSSTPSGGSYNFGTKVLTVPTGSGATWSASIPAGTTPVYVSKATASIQGTSGSAAVSGWTAPVISWQDGDDGASAKTVMLTASSYVFSADDSDTVTTPDYVTLTVVKQNTAAAVAWSTSPSVVLHTTPGPTGGSTTTSANPAYLRKASFGANTAVLVTATCDGLVDYATIARVRDGDSAPYVVVDNPSHPIPADSAGTVSSYTGSGTTLQVIEGGVVRTITAVSKSATGITAGSTSSLPTTVATIAQHFSMIADKAKIDYTISYTRADGSTGTALGVQVLFKAKAGATGGTGSTGTTGTRGTRHVFASSPSYTSSYPNYATQATAEIAAATAGSTPTTPIKGDEVTFTNNVNYTYTMIYTGVVWDEPGVVIDGDLLVTGSVTATKINAAGLRVGTGGAIQAAGYPGVSLDGNPAPSAGAGGVGARFYLNSNGYAHVDTIICWGQIFTATIGASASVTSPVILGKNTSSGPGLKGESSTGVGGLFVGNTTRGCIELQNQAVLPSNKGTGQLVNVNNDIYWANGSTWTKLN